MVEISTHALASGVVVVVPEGILDLEAAPALREALEAAFRDGATQLVVDLTKVEAIDSVGLGGLISGLKTARKNGGDLRIANPGERVKAILKLASLDRFFKSPDTAF